MSMQSKTTKLLVVGAAGVSNRLEAGGCDMNSRPKKGDGISISANPVFEIRTVSYLQAAELMGCSLRTVKRLVKSGDLTFARLGKVKGVRIFVRSIEKYLEERTGQKIA